MVVLSRILSKFQLNRATYSNKDKILLEGVTAVQGGVLKFIWWSLDLPGRHFSKADFVSYLMNFTLPWAKLCGVVEWRECGGSKYGWWWWWSGWWPMWRPALWTPCPCWACKPVTEPVRLAMLELLLLEFGWDEPTNAWVVPSFCNLGFRGPRSCCTAKKMYKKYSTFNDFVKSQVPWVKLLAGQKKNNGIYFLSFLKNQNKSWNFSLASTSVSELRYLTFHISILNNYIFFVI